MTAQDQINAYSSIGSFFSQWGTNIAQVATGVASGGLTGGIQSYANIIKDDAKAYLQVKDTAEESTFGKVATAIADVKYNGSDIGTAVSNAGFNGWDALVAGAELLPISIPAVAAKIITGDKITEGDLIDSGIDAIGLVPIAGWAAKATKTPAKIAVKTITKTGDAAADAEKIAAKTAKIERGINAASTTATLANIGLTAIYAGNILKSGFDEIDKELQTTIVEEHETVADTDPYTNLNISQTPDGNGNPAWIQGTETADDEQTTVKQKTLADAIGENTNTLILSALLIALIIITTVIIDKRKDN